MAAFTALDVIGLTANSGRDLIDAIRKGFPIEAIDHLIKSGRISLAEIDLLVIPRKTLSRRRKLGTLTAGQFERLLRTAQVIAAAEETFGAQDKAARWLRRPTEAAAGNRPLDLLDTWEGAALVKVLLGRIGHGIAA